MENLKKKKPGQGYLQIEFWGGWIYDDESKICDKIKGRVLFSIEEKERRGGCADGYNFNTTDGFHYGNYQW